MNSLYQSISIDFVNKKEDITVNIMNDQDGIYIKYNHNSKECMIKCLTNDFYTQNINYNEVIVLPGQHHIDERFQEPILWINEMIRKSNNLPDKKKQLLDNLIKQFPLFNDYEKINVEESLSLIDIYETKRKDIYDVLIEKADKFDLISQNISFVSNKIKKITKDQIVISKNLFIKEKLENNNVSISELVEQCKLYNKWRKDIHNIENDFRKNNKRLSQEEEHNYQSIINAYKDEFKKSDEYIHLIYREFIHNDLPRGIKISYQDFILLFSSKKININFEQLIKLEELKDKEDNYNVEHYKISFDISLLLSQFHNACVEIITLDQELVKKSILFLKQEQFRKKAKRKSLTEQEKKIEQIRNAFKELYINYRVSCSYLKNSIDESLFFDDIEHNLIRNDLLEEKLFKEEKDYHQKIIPEYNNSIIFDEQVEEMTKKKETHEGIISSLGDYKDLINELEFQYKIYNDKKRKELIDKNSLYHKTVLRAINSIPNDVKNEGLRKFDSKYYNFYEWLLKKNKEIENQTPLDFIKKSKNSEDKDIIIKLIQNLPYIR